MPVLIFCAVLHVFFAGTVSGGRKGRFLSVKTRLNPAAANAMGVLPPGEVISGGPWARSKAYREELRGW